MRETASSSIPPEVPQPPRRPPEWPVPEHRTEPRETRLPWVVESLAVTPEERLLERRIVTATGFLDAERATALAATLLHLDALAAAPVTVRLDASGAEPGAVLMLIDTFDAMRSTVRVVAVGQVVGAAVALLAAANERLVYPHARIVMSEPQLPAVQGDSVRIATQAAEHRRLLDDLYSVIATGCGRTPAEVEQDARGGRFLAADQAVAYGLADAVVGRDEADTVGA